MAIFNRNNWDINLWIAAQVLALVLFKAFTFSFNMTFVLRSLIGIFLIISIVAMFIRMNKIRKYKQLRAIILLVTAILIIIQLVTGVGFDTDFAVISGGLV